MADGRLSFESVQCRRVTWKVPNFLQVPWENNYTLKSPTFRYAGHLHRLLLHKSNSGFFYVRPDTRICKSHQQSRNVLYNLRFQSSAGEEIDLQYKNSSLPHDAFSCYYLPSNFVTVFTITRQELERNRDSYLPDGTFTLICYLTVKSSVGSPESEKVETSDREQEGLPGVAKLQADYKQLLQTGAESDALFQVSGKEFRVHRCVLRARSAVFDAMFRHETVEKASGRVVIKDFDPDCFGHFLEYLYTGVVGTGLSDDNAFELYVAADKYDVPSLKSECMAYMRRTLSVDSFCDVFSFALQHDEKDLRRQAVIFLKENLSLIVATPKWQQFVIDNGEIVSALFSKSLAPGEQ